MVTVKQVISHIVVFCINVTVAHTVTVWLGIDKGYKLGLLYIGCLAAFLLYLSCQNVKKPDMRQMDTILLSMCEDLKYTVSNYNVLLPLTDKTDLAWTDTKSSIKWHTRRRAREIARSLGWTLGDLTREITFGLCEERRGDVGSSTTCFNWKDNVDFMALRNLLAELPAPTRCEVPIAMAAYWKKAAKDAAKAPYVYEAVVKSTTGIRWIHITLERCPTIDDSFGYFFTKTVKVSCKGEMLDKASLHDHHQIK